MYFMFYELFNEEVNNCWRIYDLFLFFLFETQTEIYKVNVNQIS